MLTLENATMVGSNAEIPTKIQCNPIGGSQPGGTRLDYFAAKSVAEVTAYLEQGAQPMLVGCTADVIEMVVKVRHLGCQPLYSDLLTLCMYGTQCPLHGRRASMPVRVADASGRMTVGHFCKHFSPAFIAMMRVSSSTLVVLAGDTNASSPSNASTVPRCPSPRHSWLAWNTGEVTRSRS